MKRLILIIFLGLLFCGSIYAQSLEGQWQLQNPNDPNGTQISYFGPKTYMVVSMNASTGQNYVGRGIYTISGNLLTFQPTNGKIFYLTINWDNSNQFTLNGETGRSVYTRISASYATPSMPSNNTYSVPKSTASQPCWPCNGTGRCNVCGGKGTIVNNKCPDCFGSGVCKHCSGTGIFQAR